ncbi:MAG TPA: oligosaccharide flippase family protein [Candidatus Dormibacteraeota bacterium]|nr:oligosaccharide flippase family protein [Candidatus Dormibacteraeota bacterium]
MNRLYKNFALLTASNLLTPLFTMVLVLVISRLQGVEILGKYSLMMTVFVVGQSCVSLGLPVVITREVAKNPGDAGRYFLNACVVTFVIAGVAVGVALSGLRWTAEADLRTALSLVLLSMFPSVVTQYGEAVLLAFERASDLVVISFTESAARALVGTIVVCLGGGVAALALSLLTLRLLAGLAFLVMLHRRRVSLAGGIDRVLCAALARDVPVLGSIPIVNALYARADVFLLTSLGTWTEVGLYSAALRLVDVVRTIAPAYGRALYPVLARLQVLSAAEFAALGRRSIREILLLVLPFVLVLAGFAQPLIVGLYGQPLAGAADVLHVLAWSLIPTSLATGLAQILFAARLQAIDLRVNVIATVFIVLVGLVLVPRWGAAGAALAVLLASSLYAGLQYVFVRSAVMDPVALALLGKLAAVATTGALVSACTPAVPALAGGVIAVIAYAIAIWVTGILGRADLDRVFGLLGSLPTSAARDTVESSWRAICLRLR